VRSRAPSIRHISRLGARHGPGRLLGRLGPPALVALMVAAAFAVSPLAGDARTPITAADCLVAPEETPVEQLARTDASVTVEAVLGRRGEQIGRRLEVQTQSGSNVSVPLGTDSFVGAAPDGRVLYAQRSAGGGSEIRAVSVETGCDIRLAGLTDVVRSVLQSPVDGALYVHTVVEPDRRDGGIDRFDPSTAATTQVLPPFEPSPEFGLIYGTQLAWAADQKTLVVQSCGIEECITRTVGSDGTVATYDAPQGALVGLIENALITFAPDHGRPADLLAIDRWTGIARVVADDVFEAHLTDADPPTLMIETSAGRHEVLP
jgi:hypothetical protein